MSQEEVIINQFIGATSKDWSTQSDYDQVNALLVHWEDDDLNVITEVENIKKLFEDNFKFKTKEFPIPSSNSQAALQTSVSSFIEAKGAANRSLIIVYYAGHSGEQDALQTEPGYALWRAKEKGGASLYWYHIQPLLFAAHSDVLIILDCCHAAGKLPGRLPDIQVGKMELLAASGTGLGAGSRVPEPGPRSFTSVLVREIKRSLKKKEGISIKWLAKHLWSDMTTPAVTCTPVHFSIDDDDQKSIVLKPLPEHGGYAKRKQPPSSFVFLKISLDDDPTGLQIAKWLKSFPPKVVRSVDIEGLVLKARTLESLHSNTIFAGSVLGNLSNSAKEEIMAKVRSLTRTVSSTAAMAVEPELTIPDAQPDDKGRLEVAQNIVDDMQNKVAAVCESIEGGVVLDPTVNLEQAAKDDVVVASGATVGISLRQQLLNTNDIPVDLEIPKRSIKYVSMQRGGNGKSRFRYGVIAGKRVIVEGFSYLPYQDTSHPSPNTMTQIKRMCTQLSLPKDASFHALSSVGYIKEDHLSRLGVVFDVDKIADTDDSPVLLSEMLPKRRRVPLGRRIKLASTLAVALESFHRVGWVHKEIKSSNIAFFLNKETTEVDSNELLRPFIFGFECSRPEDMDSEMKTDFTLNNNAYRHPERWGKPQQKFERAHDVYSLGIVFLEIAFWRPILQIAELQNKQNGLNLDPEVVKAKLVQRVQNDLPFLVGQAFADAVGSCLTFKEQTVGMTEFQVHQTFNTRVVQGLITTFARL